MINKIKNRSEKWKFIISKQGLKVYDVWTLNYEAKYEQWTQQVNNKNKLQLAVAGCKPLLQTKPSKNFQNVHFLTNGNTDFVQAVSAVYSDLQRQMIKIKFTNTLNYQNIYDNWQLDRKSEVWNFSTIIELKLENTHDCVVNLISACIDRSLRTTENEVSILHTNVPLVFWHQEVPFGFLTFFYKWWCSVINSLIYL